MSNISRAGNLVQQFLDFDGTPLSNGVLCTFIAGTTTPIATYRDNHGSFNETEIKLNSRGECDVWLDASVKYKFVLKKADGSIVWAKDDVMADAVYELPSRIVDTVEGDGDVSVTAVMDGDSIKYIVRLNKDFATKEELEEGLSKIRPEFVFNENVDVEKFAEAFTNNYVLVYEKSVTNPASRSNTTRRFLLSKKEQRLGSSSVSLTFECTEGETLHKVVITYDIVDETLSFGDIESYGIKDKDDVLAAALNEEIAERQQADSVLEESFQNAVARLENKDDELEAELNGKASTDDLDNLEARFASLEEELGKEIPEGTGEDNKLVNESILANELKDKVSSDELAEEIEARKQADTAIESMVRESVERLEQKDIEVEESVKGKLGSVAHDSTLQGDGTADNPLKVVGGGSGGGIEEAPDDGKQYARKSKSWVEVQGGASSWDEISGKPSAFPPSAHYHSVDDITDFPAIPTKTSDLQNDSGFINLPEDKSTERLLLNNGEWKDLVIIGVDDIDDLDWSLDETLIIDGLEYRFAKMPDGRIWMCENLQAAQGSAAFYNNDEATYGRNGKNYGRLYNWNDAMAVANRVYGWHVPTTGEWDALANAVGGSNVAGTKLKSTVGWNSGDSTDDYGFSVFPAGFRNNVSFSNVGGYGYFWTATESSSTFAHNRHFSTGEVMESHTNNKTSISFSIRLIKDA